VPVNRKYFVIAFTKRVRSYAKQATSYARFDVNTSLVQLFHGYEFMLMGDIRLEYLRWLYEMDHNGMERSSIKWVSVIAHSKSSSAETAQEFSPATCELGSLEANSRP
jgi:hypothetical protein